MKKLTDEEIDSLFKEAAAGYEPAYHSSDWVAMNKKLEGIPFRMPRWTIIAGIGALVFLSGIGVGVWMNSQPVVPTQQTNALDIKSDAKSDKPAGSEGIEVKESKPSLILTKPSTHHGAISSNSLPRETNGSPSSLSFSSSHAQLSNALSGNSISKNRNRTDDIAPSTDQPQPVLPDSESKLLKMEALVDASTSNPGTTQSQDLQPIETTQEVKTIDSTSIHSKEEPKADSLAKKDSIEPSKKLGSDGKWFIRVMASPDNSSINFSSSAFAGSNFSTLIEYQLSNRWSLSTGVILSNKKYTTDAEVVYGGKKANGLDGSCRIIDIPMMAYYRISTSSRFSFYSGIGVSSYLMLSENYKYSVVYNSTSYPYDTKVEGKNNEWFKLINLSLGVNYQLTSRWSMLAEPFAKLPMAGVGEGKVMLSSTGLFLGLKYKIH